MIDVLIQDAVMAALRHDPRVHASDVGVEVHGGVVTLTGSVHTWAARAAAQDAALRAGGVRDVANEIVVDLPGTHAMRSDVEIAQAVRKAVEAVAPTRNIAVSSAVTAGVVTLEGCVDSSEERDAVVSAAGHAPGVRRVQCWIHVKQRPTAEEEIHASITRALTRRADHIAKQIQVSLRGDVVILTGSVSSDAERTAVVGAVKGIAGKRLIDGLELHLE